MSERICTVTTAATVDSTPRDDRAWKNIYREILKEILKEF